MASGTAVEVNKPADRSPELQSLWDTYMGVVGQSAGVLKGQEDYMAGGPVSEHTDLLTKLINSSNEEGGILRQQGVSLGGGSPITFVPKTNIEAAKTTAGLSSGRLGTKREYAPGWSAQKFLDYLTPVLSNLEGFRSSMPGQTTQNMSETPSTMESAPGWLGAGSDLASIAKSLWGKGGVWGD